MTLTSSLRAESVATRHVREVTQTGEARAVGRLPGDQSLQIDIVLKLRDPAGLTGFLRELYDPASPSYRRYLSVAQFTERFGPSAADYEAVRRYAASHGLQVEGGTRDGLDVLVRGPVAAIEAAFHLNLRTYEHPTEKRQFYAPDREPVTELAFPLWHVSGLDNFSLPHPLYVKRGDYARAHGIDPAELVTHASTGSGPSQSFLGSDMRAAYYGGTALTGAGQNLGLFEYAGTDLADLTTYYENIGGTNTVPITLLSTDGTSTACVDSRAGGDCDDTEQTLDMTQALGMAPGLASLVVYVGSLDTAIIAAMTTHSPLPTTIGCSWGWTPADPTTLDPYFEKMAAQGQTFLAASGDSSTWSSSNEAWPADDANVVSVGGTDLVTTGAAGAWKSETAWVDSGGGISPDSIAIPAWQQLAGVINSSNKGSTKLRNGPDVAANANFSFYVCADQTTCTANEYGGTSFAAPMWAAYLALANQQLAAKGDAPVGFINPQIYAQNVSGGALSAAYATDFHDSVSGTSGSYSAEVGYDLVTGWGSPNGVGLINALGPTTGGSPAFSLTLAPASLSVKRGATGTATVTTAVSGGFDAAITLSASGAPSGVTIGLSPSVIAKPGSGSSTLSLAVASTTVTGTYAITVTATGGGVTNSRTISLTVTAATTGSFALSVSPTSGYLDQGQSGYAVVTSTVSGGFDAPVTLAATGIPTGVTGGFSPASITGTGTSDFTLTVARNAPIGTYPITITGSSGGVTESTVLTFSVKR
jgi:kumamolisin